MKKLILIALAVMMVSPAFAEFVVTPPSVEIIENDSGEYTIKEIVVKIDVDGKSYREVIEETKTNVPSLNKLKASKQANIKRIQAEIDKIDAMIASIVALRR